MIFEFKFIKSLLDMRKDAVSATTVFGMINDTFRS